MGSLSLLSLSTISQYALFCGIALILFGWFEKKERLAYLGQAVFIVLGIFAVWILSANTYHFQTNGSAEIPKEIKVLSFLKLSVWLAALNIVSLLLGILKNKYYKASLFIVILAGLSLFFMIFNLLQSPAN